jgi:phosphatidylglycerol:prolipoprotein diacylglycerol transferase
MLVFLVGLEVYGKSSRPGLTTATVLTVYGVGRFIDEFWRQPDLGQPVYWGWMSKGQLLTIPVIVAGLFWLLWYRVHAVGAQKNERGRMRLKRIALCTDNNQVRDDLQNNYGVTG